jgi:hypothetical protein
VRKGVSVEWVDTNVWAGCSTTTHEQRERSGFRIRRRHGALRAGTDSLRRTDVSWAGWSDSRADSMNSHNCCDTSP